LFFRFIYSSKFHGIRNSFFNFSSFYDEIYKSFFLNKFRSLETFWQIFTYGFADYSRPAKPIKAPGSAIIISAVIAKDAVIPPKVGSHK
jgi:hypothetical protein